MEEFARLFLELGKGLGITLSLFGLTLACSIPLGFLGSQVSLSKNKPIKFIYTIYLTVIRGTPLILQVVFMYFGINIILIKLGVDPRIDRYPAALLAFIINYTAYFSEIFRGGIQSINKGQYEAASVLGLTKRATTMKIVIPQVFKIVMPSLGNEVITLVKDTALVNIIAVTDLMYLTYSAVSRDVSIMPLFVAGIFYLAINSLVSAVLKRIEKRMNYYRI
ncbi:amino acid ABC transporter permease [Christensenellaceae bacterium OttesenSCG-928-K19]|nr:amino acid ABC transporter permease [Christensenellaceae bacterium OttesenSCG-928-K19]